MGEPCAGGKQGSSLLQRSSASMPGAIAPSPGGAMGDGAEAVGVATGATAEGGARGTLPGTGVGGGVVIGAEPE